MSGTVARGTGQFLQFKSVYLTDKFQNFGYRGVLGTEQISELGYR